MEKKVALMGASCLIPAGVILMAARTLEQIRAEQQDLIAASQALVDLAETEDRDLAEEEMTTIEANRVKIENLGRQIQARESVAPAPQPQGRRTTPEPVNPDPANPQARRTVPASPRANDPRNGFRAFGEFAQAVRQGSIQGNQPDRRLLGAATSYGNEGTGTDGGFLVPPTFSTEIWQKVMAEENLLSRCSPLVTGTNSMIIPKDETTPWQTSGGIQVYWEGEASTITGSKPAFEMSTVRLVKLTALVPVSDELLEDAVGLESWLRAKAPAKMTSKINTGVIAGTGVGQPLGMLPGYQTLAPSVISVAKETSQAAASIYFANINKMWARMYAPWRRNAVWLINQDIEPQLDAMAFDPAATSKVPVYLPPGGVSTSPYASLKGRPVVPIEACSTIGVQGDIILTDLNQYWAVTKAAGMATDTSMHLYFDQALTTFRFIFRLNGMPAWSAPITPQNGSNTRSWAITLDAR